MDPRSWAFVLDEPTLTWLELVTYRLAKSFTLEQKHEDLLLDLEKNEVYTAFVITD